MREFYQLGLWKPEIEFERESEYFLSAETIFWSKNAYLGFREPNFWDTHEMKEIYRETVWELEPGFVETGLQRCQSNRIKHLIYYVHYIQIRI